MESDWRWGVWKIGLADGYTTLAARILTAPTFVVVRSEQYAGDPVILWQVPGVSQDYTFVGHFAAPPGHPHFPFGYPVAPDRPV